MRQASMFTQCILLMLLLLLMCEFIGCIFVSAKVGPFFRGKEPLREVQVSGSGKNKILVLNISGMITSEDIRLFSGILSQESTVEVVKEQLNKAMGDDQLKALILRINTPGGTVTGSDIVYRELKRFKEERGVEIVASMMEVSTSGGLYVAMAADKIMAHPTTVTGSIGVIFQNFNVEELFKKIGIKDISIKSGDKKDMGSPFRKITGEEEEILKNINSDLFEKFLETVADGRKGLEMDNIRSLADGRIFSSKQALDAGLIDEIGYLEDAIEMAKRGAGISKASIVMYTRPGYYKSSIYSQAPISGLGVENTLTFGIDRIYNSLTPRFMYLWVPGLKR